MRIGYKAVFALLAAGVVGGISTSADATTALLLTRDELVQRSTVVARVTVGKSVTRESDDGKAIITRTELKVTQPLKGGAPATLVVERIGGTFRGKTQKIDGDGKLVTGEDAVVFLRGDTTTAYFTALAQSVYHVTNGMAQRDLDGLAFAVRTGGRIQAVATPAEPPEGVEHLMTDVVRMAGGK